MIIIQLILYCLLFTGMVAVAVRGGAINGIYFYPKAVQERVIEIGLTDRDTISKKKKAVHEHVLYCDACSTYFDYRTLEPGFGFWKRRLTDGKNFNFYKRKKI